MYMNIFSQQAYRVVYDLRILSGLLYRFDHFSPTDSPYSPVRAVVTKALVKPGARPMKSASLGLFVHLSGIASAKWLLTASHRWFGINITPFLTQSCVTSGLGTDTGRP